MRRVLCSWVGVMVATGCGPLEPVSLEPSLQDPAVGDTDALFDEALARTLRVPLGETLFFAGDDYLAFWGAGHPDPVEIVEAPEGADLTMAGDGSRWTPDVAGRYVLRRGDDEVPIQVSDDPVSTDAFLNYNYTPVAPIAQVDEDTLLVTVPFGNVIQRISVGPAGAAVDGTIPVGSWPTSVVMWPGSGYALVAQTGRDSLGFLDLTSWRIEDAILVGDEPAGIVIDGDTAYVTTSGADQVVRVDLTARTVTGRVDVGRDPRSMALDRARGRLFVASLMSSNTTPLGPLQVDDVDPESQRDIAIVDTSDFTLTGFVPEVGTMIRGLHLSESGDELIAAVSHSRNTRHLTGADVEPHGHSLARVDVTDDGLFDVVDVDLDNQASSTGPAPSPFTMMNSPTGDSLIVTMSAGSGVLVLARDTLEELGRVQTGSDPRGLAYAHGRIWTTSWLDNQLEGFAWPSSDSAPSVDSTVVLGHDPRSEDVRAGQAMFNNASFSANKDFSCNNCHIDGLTDGLVWNLLADGNVNTIPFRNIGGTDPFLWGGQLPTLFDFSREVLRLVGANATGAEMEQITTYMQSVTAPPNPFALPGGKLSASALRGEALFHEATSSGGAGCGGCHAGPLYTSGLMVDGKTEGKRTDVPALIGVYDTAPYGREGQWATLEEMVSYAAEYTGATLDDSDVADLVQFMKEIPGDALYLNAARPLSGADHVWFETPLELTFSQVLSPGQKDLFSFELVEIGRTEPVAGSWSLSGRVARFVPDEPLTFETKYRMSVASGLEGALGHTLYEPIEVDFTVGSVPDFDVSGEWQANLLTSQVVLPFELDFDVSGGLALLQAVGGNLTGVMTSEFDEADIDHVRGVTSGSVVVLEPFRVASVIGDVMVEESTYQMYDEDSDGWAESGYGEVSVLGFVVPVELVRLSYPDAANVP